MILELPEDVMAALEKRFGNLSRHALEALAVEGYHSGALTESQVRRMLGFETRAEVNAFLLASGAYYDQTESDLDREFEITGRYRKIDISEG